jgi:hypothetical protein
MLTMPGSRVTLPTHSIRFPPVCPHCLGEAKTHIVLKTRSELVSYYVVYMKWRHLRLEVPFCRRLVLFPRRYIDLVAASEAGVQFDVLSSDYAQALAALNGGTYYEKFQPSEPEKS